MHTKYGVEKFRGNLVVLLIGGIMAYNSFPPEYEDSGYQVVPSNYDHVNTLPMDNGAFYGRTPWSGAHPIC